MRWSFSSYAGASASGRNKSNHDNNIRNSFANTFLITLQVAYAIYAPFTPP